MRFKLFLLFTLFGMAHSASAQAPKIEFTEFDLDNGLHVILHQDNTTPIVCVSVMYHVGSKNENPERTGFAHFFEHLLFEGSENIDRGEFDNYVEGAGGTLNANTSNDRTYYYEIMPSHQLELALWLESERMLHAKVEEIGIETQREVVKEERRQRIENPPYGTVLLETFARAFKEHPYNWPVIGSMEHINAAEEQDYVDFYNTFYVPNNAVLSIAGDMDIDQAKDWIKKYFAEIPKGTKEIPRPEVVEPALEAEVRDVVYDNIQLPAVIHGFRIPAQGTDDFYAVDMLATMLAGGQSSRLYRSLVDDNQAAISTGAFPFQLEDPGLTLAFAILNPGITPEEAEALMDAEYEKAGKELMSDREFQKLRNQFENDLISANTSMAGIAESLANYHMYFGDANLINTEIDRYMAVTKEDIMRVAKTYFVPSNRVALTYLSKELEDKP